jgi:hypothetical protein
LISEENCAPKPAGKSMLWSLRNGASPVYITINPLTAKDTVELYPYRHHILTYPSAINALRKIALTACTTYLHHKTSALIPLTETISVGSHPLSVLNSVSSKPI